MIDLNRRNLLKGISSIPAVATLSGLVPASAQTLEKTGANPVLLNKLAGEKRYSTCLRNCGARCLLRFTVQNGRATWVEGADEQPKTGTCPCVKGLTYVQYIYSADRLLHPMVRIGPKGSRKWKRISWEEAWKLLIRKTHETVEKYGAHAVLPYSYSGNYGVVGMRAPDRFFNRLGASYLDRNVCAKAVWTALTWTIGQPVGVEPHEIAKSDCYISWGINETACHILRFKDIVKMRDRGGKVLVVDPHRTPLASQADVWLQPKPSTDAWVVVGLLKVLFEKNLADREFLHRDCIGGDELEPFVASIKWEDIVRTTGIPKAKLEKFATTAASCKTSVLGCGAGINRNYNGGRMTHAIPLFSMALGHVGKPHSGFSFFDAILQATLNTAAQRGERFLTGNEQHVNMTSLDTALLAKNPTSEGKPIKPIHMVFFYNGNPVAVAPNSNQIIEDFKRDDLFVVGFDMIMTDSMDYCDLILPAASQFECLDMACEYDNFYVQVCEKIIDPLGESKGNWDFFSEWGRRMGFKEHEFTDTDVDIIKQSLDGASPWWKQVTWEDLCKRKWIHVDMPNFQPRFGEGKIWTESGKYEVRCDNFRKYGFNPLIDLGLPEEEMIPEERDLPFRLFSPALIWRENSEFANVKYMRTFNDFECEINPKDAQKLGIKTGDRIKLTNQRGHAYFVARVCSRVAPGAVCAAKNNWLRMNPYGRGTGTNCLTTSRVTDIGGCSAYHSTRVKVERA